MSIRLGARFPSDGQVGDYYVDLDVGFVVIGELRLFGMDAEAAGFAMLLSGAPKHAGHPQGEAEMEIVVEGTWAIDLTAEPAEVAFGEVSEGHYFDGSLRLRPCTEVYDPVFAGSRQPVGLGHDLWGHTLLLRGTALRDASEIFRFDISADVEIEVAGLEYAGTIKEGGATSITTLIDLEALLGGIDFADLADEDGEIVLNELVGGDVYDELLTRLQDPTLYLHQEMESIPVH